MTQLPLALADEMPAKPQPKRRSFHARHCHMTVEEAQAGESRAKGQEFLILAAFEFKRCRLTPSEVHSIFPQWPLTSVRRALTNMATDGLLTHHPADRRPGPWGSMQSTWSLPEGEQK